MTDEMGDSGSVETGSGAGSGDTPAPPAGGEAPNLSEGDARHELPLENSKSQGSLKDAFNEAAPLEPEEETASSDFVVPRAANDDVAGAKYDQSEGTPVIGRLDDTEVAGDWEGHTVIDLRANPDANEFWAEAHERGDLRPDGRPVTEPGWSPELNEEWIGSIIANGAIVHLGSEPAGDNLLSGDHQHPSVFSTEITQLQDAGYQRVGDYLVPEELAAAFADRSRPPTDRGAAAIDSGGDIPPPPPLPEHGALKDAFNKAAPRQPDDGSDPGGDGGDASQGDTDAEALTTDLEPGLDDGRDS